MDIKKILNGKYFINAFLIGGLIGGIIYILIFIV